MATRVNGSYGSLYKVGGSSTKRKMRAYLIYDVSYTATKCTVKVQYGIQVSGGSYSGSGGTMTASGTGYSNTAASSSWSYGGATEKIVTTRTFTYTRPKKAETKTFKASYNIPSGRLGAGTYTASASVSVSIMPSITVSLDANGGEVSPATVTKWASDSNFILPTPTWDNGHIFIAWQDARGDMYDNNYTKIPTSIGGKDTVHAMWADNFPPSANCSEAYDSKMSTWTSYYSDINVDVDNIEVIPERTLKDIKLQLYKGSELIATSNPITEAGTLTIDTKPYLLVGDYVARVIVTDSDDVSASYNCGTLSFSTPTWNVRYYSEDLTPNLNAGGFAVITVEAYNYLTKEWDEIKGSYEVIPDNGKWYINVILGYQYTNGGITSDTSAVQIRTTYKHTDTTAKESLNAFFKTSRNANFGTGLSNTVFVSGCSEQNYSSRVWWCSVNNPLYFPDINYVEVGSNDTQIMGLCKVGDYLGVVKQSKTTDTAIFLLYPTTYEDTTTYAVRQGVQGVGALGKYTFNVLGDETLFLSPNGVMAITPSEDNEHKVQNRSYFVDGKLLKETNLASAFSFVHDGKYYLALGDACYVLDGNQRNSWGNDRTNLVYEAYYIENIPADCFMKYSNTITGKEELWFSDSQNIYRFKDETEGDAYVDEYIEYDDEENEVAVFEPVKSEWSTIFDDDGSLHYFKTTEKKGSVISFFPTHETAEVDIYVRKDSDTKLLGTRTIEGDIPTEFYPNRKFKKYKRLQFIIKCSKGGFGVDSVVKPYTLGNYSKNRG